MTVKHALLVDDEPTVLNFVQKVLTRNGFECCTAEDAGQALAEMNKRCADIVVTDVHMPGSDGAWLLGTIKRHWPEVPVIVLTGDEQAELAVSCLKRGATDYLVKPIEVANLLLSVRSALGLDDSNPHDSRRDGA